MPRPNREVVKRQQKTVTTSTKQLPNSEEKNVTTSTRQLPNSEVRTVTTSTRQLPNSEMKNVTTSTRKLPNSEEKTETKNDIPTPPKQREYPPQAQSSYNRSSETVVSGLTLDQMIGFDQRSPAECDEMFRKFHNAYPSLSTLWDPEARRSKRRVWTALDEDEAHFQEGSESEDKEEQEIKLISVNHPSLIPRPSTMKGSRKVEVNGNHYMLYWRCIWPPEFQMLLMPLSETEN